MKCNCSDVTGKLLGVAFCQYAASRTSEEGCIVLLTKELADHLADMYDNTDWEKFIEEDPDDIIDVSEDIFGEFVDREKLKTHLGEYIYLAVYGDPWPNVMSAESIPHGLGIKFMDDSMDLAVTFLDELVISDCRDDFIWELNKAVTMMLKSGLSDTDILNRFLISSMKYMSGVYGNR